MRRLPDLALLAVASVLLVRLLLTFAARNPYPYDLEWMEGGMLAHAWRLQRGLPLYTEPGPAWIPYVYPPGYPAVLAALGYLTPLGPSLGRTVSLAGSGLAAVCCAALVLRSGGSRALAFGAAVAFLGTYEATGAFYDLVRPDGLFVGLLAAAVAAVVLPGRPLLAGLLLAAAFAMKHNAAFFGPALLATVALRDGRAAALRYLIASAGTSLAWVVPLEWWTDGRFLDYLVRVPASHPVDGPRMLPGTPAELVSALPIAAFLAMAALLSSSPRSVALPALLAGLLAGASWWGVGFDEAAGMAAVAAAVVAAMGRLGDRPAADRWPAVLGGGLAATTLLVVTWMRGHHGGFLNVLMPAFWGGAVGLGLLAARLDRRAPGLGAVVVLAQLLWQLNRSSLDRLVPTAEDEAAGRRIVNRLRGCPGPVWSPFAGWMPVQAGKEPGPHLIALWDVAHKDGPLYDGLDAVRAAVAGQHWVCILDAGSKNLAYGIPEHYRAERLDTAPGVLIPATGWRIQPKLMWVPAPPE